MTAMPWARCTAPAALSALLGTAVLPHRLDAQAPATAGQWRVSATTLAGPAALETGATAAFWNPAAAVSDTKVRLGAQTLKTPDVPGVSGLVAGASYQLAGGLAAQLLVARTDNGDLVRTTTSPTSDLGDIPVYEQHLGLGVAAARGPLALGLVFRAHQARLDAERDHGFSLDAGFRLTLGPAAFGAATHFFPVTFAPGTETDFYAGAECRLARPRIWGTPGRWLARYGVTTRKHTGPEHGAGTALELAQRFRVDLAVVREVGYADAAWRPTVGVLLRVGRYAIAAARSSGLGDLGASYRIGLDVELVR